ncbi:MAG: hypothetical protein RI924_56 [Bacteroidota bacterium]
MLYEESDVLGDHFKNLQKDKSELLKGKNFELNKKYGFRNKLEIKRVFELIDSINKNLKESYTSDSELGEVWKDYDDVVAKNTKRSIERLKSIGADTSHWDTFAKKYGIDVSQTKFVSNAETTELLTLLNSLMNK